jgi:hypothetical protein
MKTVALLTLLCCAMCPLAGTTSELSAWNLWERDLNRTCPTHHVAWIYDGGYDELLYAFEKALPDKTRMAVKQVADLTRRCASERMGFSCEMGWSLETYRRLGLLGRFVRFGCKEVQCEEPALCSRLPKPPTESR